ncbi:MAG: anhydro-N-acetylmuramic acid kinase, partial [Bacteroidales bacterium]|nr:anhydro-N-acetylmuramic acid kinase [Bacteroidales bacterium]
TKSGIEMVRVLVTGGGANNQYLLELLKERIGSIEIDSIDKRIIDFKEAIIFALLAYLRANGQVNTLASVTGASRDSSGGAIYG